MTEPHVMTSPCHSQAIQSTNEARLIRFVIPSPSRLGQATPAGGDCPPVREPGLQPPPGPGPCLPTVSDLLQCYERDYLCDLAPDTQYACRLFFRRFGQEFGALPLVELTPARLKGWRDTLRHHLAPGTVRTYALILSGALRAAVEDYGWLPVHPMQGVRKPPASPTRVRFLSDDERVRLLAACQQSRSPALYLLVVLGISTGARKNELRRLRWRDVDLARGYLRLRQTKNKEPRPVPLTGQALALLRQHAALPHTDDDWVFPNGQRQQPIHFEKAWKNARERAGLRNFRFHDLRHTTASYLAMSGATLLDIATVLGHKHISMTQRYAHLTATHTHALVNQMTAQVFAPTSLEGGPHA
jgi:integrase